MTIRMELPFELDALAARQRDMIRVINITGGATIREIHARIPDPPPSICGLRTQLNRLVTRKLLRKRRSGRHSEILYLPAKSSGSAQRGAFERIAEDYFDGSTDSAVHELMKLAAEEAERSSRTN